MAAQVISFAPGFVRLQMPDGTIMSVELRHTHVVVHSWSEGKRNAVRKSFEELVDLVSGQRDLFYTR